jgi:hypothetical protein
VLETLKKYEITNIKYQHFAETLYRIRALRDFSDVKAGQLGGYVQKYSNLAHEDSCWIYDGLVYQGAVIKGNAKVRGGWVWNRALVRQEAVIEGRCFVSGDVEIFGQAIIKDSAGCSGFARIFDKCIIRECGSAWGHAICHGRSEIYGYACASGTSELKGNFKLRGNGRLLQGVYETGVIESWSPYLTDTSLHG